MRPHPRRARTDPQSPRAWATSDRNGMIGNHQNLCWQYQWTGSGLINTRVLVHEDELDIPQRQLGVVIIPPDPPPIMNARPEQYAIDEVWPMLMEIKTSYDEIPMYFEQSTSSDQNASMAFALETSTEP